MTLNGLLIGLFLGISIPYQKKILSYYNQNDFIALFSKTKSCIKSKFIKKKIIPTEDKQSSVESSLKAPFNYWKVPLEDRLKSITKQDGRKKVIYIDESPFSNSSRYRVYNVLEALEFSDIWNGTYFYLDELEKLDLIIPSLNIVIFARTRWSFCLDTFFKKIKNLNINLSFEFMSFKSK